MTERNDSFDNRQLGREHLLLSGRSSGSTAGLLISRGFASDIREDHVGISARVVERARYLLVTSVSIGLSGGKLLARHLCPGLCSTILDSLGQVTRKSKVPPGDVDALNTIGKGRQANGRGDISG